ncbi:hypothetical protein VQ643_11105 [Pseudomonas sp. F1_0610]|uniref:hypothetical protein n=1 Tax=Pseudomonas sp. F1_0610 TaxID=3114284 RepID=UPI0039C1DBEC
MRKLTTVFCLLILSTSTASLAAELRFDLKQKASNGSLVVVDTWGEKVQKSDLSVQDVQQLQKQLKELQQKTEKLERKVADLERQLNKR